MWFVFQFVSLGLSSLIGMYIEIVLGDLTLTAQPFA